MQSLSAYFELTKPRITILVLVTTALGFFLGGRGIHSAPLLVATLLGTALTAGGSAALKPLLRTRDRPLDEAHAVRAPLPLGVITPAAAVSYGLCLILAGLVLLINTVNLITAFLALLTAFLYVVIYTPMKRLTC